MSDTHFLKFFHVSLNHTITNDVDFVDKAYAEICDHSLFTL